MTRKQEIKKLDELWSLIIRSKKKCELCGNEGDIKGFDAHHIQRRNCLITRWDLDNGVCLDKGCHRFGVHMDTLKAHQLIEKLKKRGGEEWYKDLVRRSRQIVKWNVKDLEKIYDNLKKEFCENNMFKMWKGDRKN